MKPSDGGIISPSVPPTATMAAENRAGYCSRRSAETVDEPMAAAEPTDEPDTAAKNTLVISTVWASPPRMARTIEPTSSTISSAIRPRIIRLPAVAEIGVVRQRHRVQDPAPTGGQRVETGHPHIGQRHAAGHLRRRRSPARHLGDQPARLGIGQGNPMQRPCIGGPHHRGERRRRPRPAASDPLI